MKLIYTLTPAPESTHHEHPPRKMMFPLREQRGRSSWIKRTKRKEEAAGSVFFHSLRWQRKMMFVLLRVLQQRRGKEEAAG